MATRKRRGLHPVRHRLTPSATAVKAEARINRIIGAGAREPRSRMPKSMRPNVIVDREIQRIVAARRKALADAPIRGVENLRIALGA